ncbi:MAG: pentapeptide repeat-containing protein [Deltaproteobacteria bacterium]|nr:pentapeptide repeat-containing protein [Deltaproteobacteria bacterium]
MKAIENMSHWGCIIIFIAMGLWPSQALSSKGEPRDLKAITGKDFFDQLMSKGEKDGFQYNLSQCVVEGAIPEIFKVKFKGVIRISNVIFENDITIRQATFVKTDGNTPGKGDNQAFVKAVTFKKCIFKGVVRVISSNFVKGISFENCEFEDEAYFTDTWFSPFLYGENRISGTTCFENCTFKKDLNLLRSVFFTFVDFTNCRFHGDSIFGYYPYNERQAFAEGEQDNETKKAIFTGGVNFTRSIFKGKAFFPYTEFFQANFSDTIFESQVHFSKTKFQGETNFSRATFKAKADFERAIFYSNQSNAGRSGKTSDTANFYKVFFKEDVSFSKSIFLIPVDFKRASFSQRAFFNNTFFNREAKFEMCLFGKELFGSKMNDLDYIKREVTFFKLNESWKKLIKNWKDRNKNSEELAGCNEDWRVEVAIWKKIKAKDDPTAQVKTEIRSYLQRKFGKVGMDLDQSSGVFLREKEDLRELIESWQGKEAYIGQKSFKIINDGDLSCDQNSFAFIGSRFGGDLDFRGSRFNKADFSSGEIMTVFYGAADFSNASFEKIAFDGTFFLGKVSLSLEKLFCKSGMISRSLTILDLPKLAYKRHLRAEGDLLQGNSASLKNLYDQLEILFRKNSQVPEANEMAVRASWIKLRTGQDMQASFFTLIALPIRNILLIMFAFNLFFYYHLLNKRSIYGRTSESSFKPGKLPLILVHSSEEPGTKKIEHPKKKLQRYTWPLFLCLGTFFAVFSLGSEYVTKDKNCLRQMKILRLAGFIILPLFIYSLAKRSQGLHALVTFM